MTAYEQGRRFEGDVREALESHGYEVIRSAGSKTKIDLVAFKLGELLFVQCKRNGICPPAERKELVRASGLVSAFPLVAYRHKPGRAAAVVAYRELLGNGSNPKLWRDWRPDRVCQEEGPGYAPVFTIPPARPARIGGRPVSEVRLP